MNPLDDALPEEREPQQQKLLPLLQQLYPPPTPLTTDEQAQALARVRERLLQAEATVWDTLDDDTEVGIVDLPPHIPAPFNTERRQGRHIVRLLNTLAAVLIIGAIITTSVLLFAHRSPTPPVASPANTTAVVIHTQANHLTASMSLTRGPYFLGELIEADSSLTNNSHTTYMMAGRTTANPCTQAIGVSTTGGEAPHVSPPPLGVISCPAITMQFQPGQTITIHQYIALTDSGTTTLTLGANFLTAETLNGQEGETITSGPDPLHGHWPSLRINVNPHVPSDRKLSFQLKGTLVIVNGPAQALSHLLYLYNVVCYTGTSNTETGDNLWTPLASNKVSAPGCNKFRWDFAFAAVGYAMVMGHYAV